jgi:hypothetical protein
LVVVQPSTCCPPEHASYKADEDLQLQPDRDHSNNARKAEEDCVRQHYLLHPCNRVHIQALYEASVSDVIAIHVPHLQRDRAHAEHGHGHLLGALLPRTLSAVDEDGENDEQHCTHRAQARGQVKLVFAGFGSHKVNHDCVATNPQSIWTRLADPGARHFSLVRVAVLVLHWQRIGT